MSTADDDATSDAVAGARVSGLYASYRGKNYPATGYSSGKFRGVAVLRISDDDTAEVLLHELDGLVSVYLRGRFAGRVVQIMSIDDHTVHIYANAPAAWGRAHGLKGSQYEGFWGDVPRRDIEIIGEDVFDVLAAEMRRKSKNV